MIKVFLGFSFKYPTKGLYFLIYKEKDSKAERLWEPHLHPQKKSGRERIWAQVFECVDPTHFEWEREKGSPEVGKRRETKEDASNQDSLLCAALTSAKTRSASESKPGSSPPFCSHRQGPLARRSSLPTGSSGVKHQKLPQPFQERDHGESYSESFSSKQKLGRVYWL